MSTKTVPLVMYEADGKREVVGRIIVYDNGTITGTITDERILDDDSPFSFGMYTDLRIDHR